MKAQRNEASKKIGEAKRNGESADAAIKETRELGDKIKELILKLKQMMLNFMIRWLIFRMFHMMVFQLA